MYCFTTFILSSAAYHAQATNVILLRDILYGWGSNTANNKQLVYYQVNLSVAVSLHTFSSSCRKVLVHPSLASRTQTSTFQSSAPYLEYVFSLYSSSHSDPPLDSRPSISLESSISMSLVRLFSSHQLHVTTFISEDAYCRLVQNCKLHYCLPYHCLMIMFR